MTQQLFIITGGSRGLGLALAGQCLRGGHAVISIARGSSPDLDASAAAGATVCEQWQVDLSAPAQATQRLEDWLGGRAAGAYTAATLVNNAGWIPRIASLAAVPAAELAQALRIDLEAPMLLTGAFLRGTMDWTVPKKVLNISSGLGRRPMAAQAAYCAAKAGMDLFTRCLALEEAARPHGAKVCSLAPGVIDTDMQTQLRTADAASFPDRAGFIGLKTQGNLASADATASRVLAYLARGDFGSQPVADVREV